MAITNTIDRAAGRTGIQEMTVIVDENEYFRQAALRICGHLDIENAMSSCLEYLEGFLPADSMYLQLFDSGLGAMRIIAAATAAEGRKMDLLAPLPPEARTTVENWSSSEVAIINDPDLYPVSRAMVRLLGIEDSSLLVLYLLIEGKTLGHLVLIGRGKGRYSEDHARLFSLLNEPFAIGLSNALRHQEVLDLKNRLADDNRYLHREFRRLSGDRIIGEDFGLRGVTAMVGQVAPLDSPVLLLGETGVGKDVIANAIHYSSPRREGPFIKVNSGAIPETLMDSELFGHEKGAFTGALSQKRGRFERAHRGTIFLDEIGELPPPAQVRMLRVLQTREIERVGGSRPIRVDIRIIAATHRNLEDMVESNRFREDLWFRLNVFPIRIPPLRERKSDVPALVHHFMDRKSKDLKISAPSKLAPGAIDRLTAYHWPGNVRELENVIERAMILQKGGPLTFDFLQPPAREVQTPGSSGRADDSVLLDEVVAGHIRRVLQIAKGKVHGPGGAAELLGVNPSTLRNKMNKYKIPYGRRHDGE